MTRLILSTGLRDDFDRIFDFLFDHVPEHASLHIEAIVHALDVLASSPQIGRPVAMGQRELIISHGASGYLALYRFDRAIDTVFVLAVRSQRERNYQLPV